MKLRGQGEPTSGETDGEVDPLQAESDVIEKKLRAAPSIVVPELKESDVPEEDAEVQEPVEQGASETANENGSETQIEAATNQDEQAPKPEGEPQPKNQEGVLTKKQVGLLKTERGSLAVLNFERTIIIWASAIIGAILIVGSGVGAVGLPLFLTYALSFVPPSVAAVLPSLTGIGSLIVAAYTWYGRRMGRARVAEIDKTLKDHSRAVANSTP